MSDTDGDTDDDTDGDTADDTDPEIIALIKKDITEIKKIAKAEFDKIIEILQTQAIKNKEFKDDAHNFTDAVDKSELVDFINNGLDTLSIDNFQLYNFYIVIKRLVDSFKTFLIIKKTYNSNNNDAWFGFFTNQNRLYYGYCANTKDLNYIIKQVDDKDTRIIENITNHNFFDYETFSNQFNNFFKLTDKYYIYWEKGKSLTNYDIDVLIHKETKYETPYPNDQIMLDEFKYLNNMFRYENFNKDNIVFIWKNKNSDRIKTTYKEYISKFKEFIKKDLNESSANIKRIDESIKETLSSEDEKYASFLITCIKKFNIIKNLTERIVTIFFTTSETTTSETTTEIKKITDITNIAKPLIDKIETLYTGYKIYIINVNNSLINP